MKKVVLLSLLLLLMPRIADAQQPPKAAPAKAAPVAITGQVDKSAIWVGDVLRYTLQVVHDANVELVLDNFTKDRLPVTPFTVRDIEIRRGDWAGGKQAARITLLLTTLAAGETELTIPPVQVYYFIRDAGGTKGERPVDTIAAPAVKVGLRSALVPDNLAPRTSKMPPAPGLASVLTPLVLGLAGLLLLLAYSAWRLWQRMHSDDATRKLSREAREKIAQESLARVRTNVAASGADPRQWSGEMAAAVRAVIAELYQIPAASLTPQEIEAALMKDGVDIGLIAQIKTILARCEDLRYGKDSNPESGMRGQLLQAAETLMQSPQLLSA
ncbi:MAG: hypothetical protein QOF19_3513 [Alphaproteobacteria bacterium]|jgi:hypothetical protein|nr:hypothetical protein [Alphaproteobacteria bacterium]